MHPAHYRDRAALAAFVVAAHDEVAVLALGGHDRGEGAIVRLDPVGAVVDPAGVRVLHDDHAAGPDVVAAVVLVPPGRRDLQEIDVAPLADVLEHRAGWHGVRRDRLRLLHVSTPEADEIHLGGLGGHPERQVDAPDRGQDIGEDAIAARISGNVVEEDSGIAHSPLIEVDDPADLPLALGAHHELHLAGGLHLGEPGSQILLQLGPARDIRAAWCSHRGFHEVLPHV